MLLPCSNYHGYVCVCVCACCSSLYVCVCAALHDGNVCVCPLQCMMGMCECVCCSAWWVFLCVCAVHNGNVCVLVCVLQCMMGMYECNISCLFFQCTVNDCCYGPLVDCIKQYPLIKLETSHWPGGVDWRALPHIRPLLERERVCVSRCVFILRFC